MKLKERIEHLRRLYPRMSEHGQMYRTKSELKGARRKVTLHTIFVSNENTHMLRPHTFESKKLRTSKQWAAWFALELTDIHHKAVLPGLALRTGKQWAVAKIIGWHRITR